MPKTFAIYITTNKKSGTLYTGVTNNLKRIIGEHKEGLIPGFTKKYKLSKLVYFELFPDIITAIDREKQIKAGSRKKKIKLIEKMNPERKDLSEDL